MPCGQVIRRYAQNPVFAGFSTLNLKLELPSGSFHYGSRKTTDSKGEALGERSYFRLMILINKAEPMQQNEGYRKHGYGC